MRKAQVAGAMAGAFITLLFITLNHLEIGPPEHTRAGYYFFALGMFVLHGLAQAAGLRDNAPAWQWNALSIVSNTAFCFVIGTAGGLLLVLLRRRKRNDPNNPPL